MQGFDILSAWKLMNDAEQAIRSGADLSAFDEETIRKARANIAYAEREKRETAELEATLAARIEAATPRIVRSWSGFSDAHAITSPVLDGFEPCPAIEAVTRFLADDSLRFLLLLGGVGCGKTFAAMVGAWKVQERVSVAEFEHRLREHTRQRTGIARGADKWWEDAVEDIRRRPPAREWSLWEARDLPVLWDPWKAEVEAGAKPAARSRPYIVLDDLGTERESDRFFEALGAFVDYRMDARLKTVITTNLAKQDIRARYGDRIADRINHVGKSFVVGGASRRRNGAGL